MATLMDAAWAVLDRLGNYGTVALGLGFVIFIHELGHFLLAKWNGVKVEAFALGFGPALVAFRKGLGVRLGSTWPEYGRRLAEAEAAGRDPEGAVAGLGETEYSVRMIPLGGFVKMLGQEDLPTAAEAALTDPRSYPNKSVGARMAIIAAGVTMNLITGSLFFVVAYGRGGLPVTPARVGAVVAGQPAYEAGLLPGDTILTINGRGDLDFVAMQRITAMSGPGEVLHLTVRRPRVSGPIALDVQPRRLGGAEIKRMGLEGPASLELAKPPLLAPAGLEPGAEPGSGLQPGDVVKAVGAAGGTPEPVADAFALRDFLGRHREEPLTIVAERPAKKPDGAPTRVEATIPPVPAADLGFSAALGAVVALRGGSPAARAGLRVGDRLLAVDGRPIADPMRLPWELERRAGEEVEIEVARGRTADSPGEALSLRVTPEPPPGWTEPYTAAQPLDLPALGAALEVTPKVASVRPGSPADRAGLKPGDVLEAITLLEPVGGKPEPLRLELDGKKATWPGAFAVLQSLPRHAVELERAGQDKPLRITPEAAPGWLRADRGLQFRMEQRALAPMGFVRAIGRGLDESWETIRSVYTMFRSLASGDISPKALGGPLMIADIASHSARSGLGSFLQFLGILSLNLAVINFLPVPPLDGGQMLFLLAEKLRGRPLPERAMNAGMLVGLVLVLGLMSFVLYQDAVRYLGDWFRRLLG